MPQSPDRPAAEVKLKLAVDDLHVTYRGRGGDDVEAVRGVSFDIPDKPGKGRDRRLLGSIGLRQVDDLKDGGRAAAADSWHGARRRPPRRVPGADRGMVFQQYTSFGWLTVQENVEYGLRLRGIPAGEQASPGAQDPGTRRPAAVCWRLSRSSLGWHEAARGDCSHADQSAGPPADGRAVWGAGSADPLGDAGDADRHLAPRRQHHPVVTHDVSEAVYLADTVYVLSRRPARILHRIDMPTFEIVAVAQGQPQFREAEDRLLKLLYAPPAETAAATATAK